MLPGTRHRDERQLRSCSRFAYRGPRRPTAHSSRYGAAVDRDGSPRVTWPSPRPSAHVPHGARMKSQHPLRRSRGVGVADQDGARPSTRAGAKRPDTSDRASAWSYLRGYDTFHRSARARYDAERRTWASWTLWAYAKWSRAKTQPVALRDSWFGRDLAVPHNPHGDEARSALWMFAGAVSRRGGTRPSSSPGSLRPRLRRDDRGSR